MKRLIPAGLIVIIVAVSAYFVLLMVEDGTNDGEPPSMSNEFPNMVFASRNGSMLSGKDLPGKSILFFFQPDCDHCQREALAISDHAESFSDYRLYFITTSSFEAMDQFAADYKLERLSNAYFLQTRVTDILSQLGQISAPSMYIYSREKKLVKHLDGEKPIVEILKYL